MEHMQISIKTSAAVRYFGSKTKIANVLGIPKQNVTNWGEFVAPKAALRIYILSNGDIGDRIYLVTE